MATIRDYDSLLQTRPAFQGPAFYSDNGTRRIVHQVWDWHGNEYILHLYLTWQTGSSWVARHYATQYRAVTRSELSECLAAGGFHRIDWLMPESTDYFQPMVIARRDSKA